VARRGRRPGRRRPSAGRRLPRGACRWWSAAARRRAAGRLGHAQGGAELFRAPDAHLRCHGLGQVGRYGHIACSQVSMVVNGFYFHNETSRVSKRWALASCWCLVARHRSGRARIWLTPGGWCELRWRSVVSACRSLRVGGAWTSLQVSRGPMVARGSVSLLGFVPRRAAGGRPGSRHRCPITYRPAGSAG
jgi:hypothetical protein